MEQSSLPVPGSTPIAAEPDASEGAAISAITEATGQLSVEDSQKEHKEKINESSNEMEEEKALLELLQRYLSIAVSEREDRKKSSLLKDEEISQFLVLALMNDSSNVMSAAMDVFEILLNKPRNHDVLQKLPYLLPTLDKISRNKKKYSVNIRGDAVKILNVLNETKKPLGDQSMSVRNVENGMKCPSKTSTLTRAKQRGREVILKVGPNVLQHDQNRVMIKSALIKIKGIISLTFDVQKHYCIIRGKHTVPPEVFASAIANLGFQVSLVYKNVHHEEVETPILANEKNEISNENLPDYLPEDEEDNSLIAGNAVSKQKSQADNAKEASIFNSALNFVRSSFYW